MDRMETDKEKAMLEDMIKIWDILMKLPTAKDVQDIQLLLSKHIFSNE